MPIEFRLRELLADRELTQTKLQQATGLAYSTISELYHGKVRRIDVGTLETLCRVLECDVGALVRYVPDAPQPPMKPRTRRKAPA